MSKREEPQQNPTGGLSMDESTSTPGRWDNGHWPAMPDPDQFIAHELSRHEPANPPARESFGDQLRDSFIAQANRESAGLALATEREPSQSARGKISVLRHRRARTDRSWGRYSLAGLAAAAVLAFVALAQLAWPEAPPPLTLAELAERNARAWAAVRSLDGAFQLDERYVEEWVSWSEERLRYKRYVDVANAPAIWHVSDGATAWTVDAANGRLIEERSAPEGSPGSASEGERMECAMLVLPRDVSSLDASTMIRPMTLNGRTVYRLPGALDPELGAGDGVYWIDAADFLVYRVDDAAGGVLWRRIRLDVNPALADEVFRPDELIRDHL